MTRIRAALAAFILGALLTIPAAAATTATADAATGPAWANASNVCAGTFTGHTIRLTYGLRTSAAHPAAFSYQIEILPAPPGSYLPLSTVKPGGSRVNRSAVPDLFVFEEVILRVRARDTVTHTLDRFGDGTTTKVIHVPACPGTS